jgi:hypothetical protein
LARGQVQYSTTPTTFNPRVYWPGTGLIDDKRFIKYQRARRCAAGHADILVAFSKDLIHWDKDEYPLYRAGGHPDGIDAEVRSTDSTDKTIKSTDRIYFALFRLSDANYAKRSELPGQAQDSTIGN